MTLNEIIAEKEKAFDELFLSFEDFEPEPADFHSFLSKSLREVALKTLEAVRVERREYVDPVELNEVLNSEDGFNTALAEVSRRGKEVIGSEKEV